MFFYDIMSQNRTKKKTTLKKEKIIIYSTAHTYSQIQTTCHLQNIRDQLQTCLKTHTNTVLGIILFHTVFPQKADIVCFKTLTTGHKISPTSMKSPFQCGRFYVSISHLS